MRHLLFGEARKPKARRLGESSTLTGSDYYAGMNEDYRWFRQDELIHRCITTNAFYATLTEGFETVLEPTSEDVDPEDYTYVKDTIDEYNRRINLDQVLFVAQVKRSIYGRSGFEIVLNDDESPAWLLSLQSTRLRPRLNESWQLEAYQYQGRTDFYRPDEVLYLTNLDLEADQLGLSDVEPVRTVLEARYSILREDLPEIARTLWAPYVILKADTSGLPEDEAEATITKLAEVARAGKNIAINESIEATTVNLTPDIEGLNGLLDKLEEAIIADFGTLRFLLGRPMFISGDRRRR